MKEKTITILYGTFVSLMVLALGIAYAQVVTELKIEGKTEGEEQDGVYITEVKYLTNNGADTDNSEVNFFKGTMLHSKVVLGSSTSSSITYQVTIKNNTDREQVFIGIVKDETEEAIYSNTNIQPNVQTAEGITGLEAYVTTIAPGEYITFPVTYAYAGTDTSNPELQGKINFRFREKPILESSNEGETYTLEKIYAGYTPEEYEFTVSNYNENYTNGVPLTYTFETIITEGSPIEAKIYDENGNEITESVAIGGDKNTQVDHPYTLKLIWDESKNGEEYQGKEYVCNIKLIATPDDTKYLEYKIEKEFDIDITTNTPPTLTVTSSNVEATTATITATGSDVDNDTLQYTLEINNQTYGSSTTNTWNITGLSGSTTYTYTVTATDGKETAIASGNFTTLVDNIAPVIATNSLNSRTTTSITVNAKATDNNGDDLVYKLYTSTSQNGTYTLKATSSSTAQNTQITLTASSLTNYTTYWWYITVTDGTETVTSSKQSTKTYCPGTGYTCTTSYCSGSTSSTCTTCQGTGKRTYTCNDFSIICSKCSGSGECLYGNTDVTTALQTGMCTQSEVISEYEDEEGNMYTDVWDRYVCNYCGLTIDNLEWSFKYVLSPNTIMYPETLESAWSLHPCYSCSGTGNVCNHGYGYQHDVYNEMCTSCNGTGKITNVCSHNQSDSHRYCTHYTTTTLTSHSYCSHGYTSQHT